MSSVSEMFGVENLSNGLAFLVAVSARLVVGHPIAKGLCDRWAYTILPSSKTPRSMRRSQ